MKTIALRAWQKPGYAAVEVGESGLFDYLTDDERDALLAEGTLALVTEEDAPTVVEPVAEKEPVADGKPHFVGRGEPTAGTWEAEWQAAKPKRVVKGEEGDGGGA